MTTFISVGNANQPFKRIIEGVLRISSELPQPIVIQYGHTPFNGVNCISKQFIEMDEYNKYIADADLLILHAGAGAVISASQAGKIPVVMPRQKKYGEHIDDHQLELAHALAEVGKVVVAEEPEDLIIAIEEAKKRQSMAHSLKKRPPLVDSIYEILREYAKAFEKATSPN